MSCTTWAANPNAVATASSVTSLCSGIDKGGPGSAAENGMGSGTPKMVNNKSGGEKSSIGNMDAKVDSKVIRVGVNLLRSAARSLLSGSEHDSRA